MKKDGQTEKGNRLLKILIWFNFIAAIFFGLELAMKSYAFGIRRAFSQMNWVLKVEFFYQPLIWILWLLFVAGVGDGEYHTEINIFSLGILLRSLRMSSFLNEI